MSSLWWTYLYFTRCVNWCTKKYFSSLLIFYCWATQNDGM